MNTRNASALVPCLWLLCATLPLAGCGSPTTFDCMPACPAGSHCTADGCASDTPGEGSDASAAPDDAAAGGCSPACSGATPYCQAGKCVACTNDQSCPLGQLCKTVGATTACVPGCADDSRCGASTKCCGGQCLDTSKDPANCGACNNACGSQHSSALCVNGQCMAGTCAPGWGDCNNDPKDGCEANLHVDPKNCTACAMACSAPNATSGCSDGCYLASCDFGYDDCDGDATNGCEKAVLSDPKNCGGCGQTCASVPHATNACVNGACQLTSCAPGFADCNNNVMDGCEIASLSDVKNCGACGNACAQNQVCINGQCTCPPCNFPNAQSACVNNLCALGACNTNWGDCDGNAQNGCEKSLAADTSNCGKCGNVCPQGLVCNNGACTCPNCNLPNAQSACVNNQCVLSACLPNFGDCDANPANGCEDDITKDAKNCGKCGNACPNNLPYCVASTCVATPPCQGWNYNGGCWYTTALAQSCGDFCMGHGGFDAVNSMHSGNPVCTHFYPQKANGGNWMSVECCSTDNNTNWGASGAAPDPAFTHPACYLACACNN